LIVLFFVTLHAALWIPNVTTMVACGESFTPEVRGVFTGFIACFGFAGAIVGFCCFDLVAQTQGLGYAFFLSGGISALAAVSTKFMESEEDRIFRNFSVRKLADANRRTVTIMTDMNSINEEVVDHGANTGDDHIYAATLTLSTKCKSDNAVFHKDGNIFTLQPSVESCRTEPHPWVADINAIVMYQSRSRAVSVGTGLDPVLRDVSSPHLSPPPFNDLEFRMNITDMDLVEQLRTMGTIDTDGEEFLASNMKHPNKDLITVSKNLPHFDLPEGGLQIVRRLSECEAAELLHREGCEEYVPFFEWQRAFLNWIHENFNHPLFRQWNYIWHLVPKTPTQLILHSLILCIGPGTVTESFYIIILGHVLWSGPWLAKDFWQVPRPSWVLPFGFNIAISERNWSFPSGHTMGLSGTFLILALIFGDSIPILWFVYVAMTVLTCLARTALRMHWPLDTFGSCIAAPCVVLPLFFLKDDLFHNHVKSSANMISAAIVTFSIFFFTHVFAHVYVKTFLPIPSIVAHIASDPQKFKYTNVMGGIRNSFFLLGVGLGIFTVWEIRDPKATVCPFETGIMPALVAVCSTGTLLLFQNFFRHWWFETKPWTTADYYIKFFFAPIIGYLAILNASGVLAFEYKSLTNYGE